MCSRIPRLLTEMKQGTRRDNLIYLTVGLSIATLVIADFFYADSHGREMWLPSRFASRTVYTTALLAYIVFRETRRMKATTIQVLACVAIAGIVHLAIAFVFRQQIEQLPGISFSGLAVLEIFVVVLLLLQALRYLRSE